MVQLDFQPKMVGREKELEDLKTYLDKAKDGQGNTIFISGEAGIGKTRLVNELKDIAKSQGYLILSGNSLYESLTPYMPFMEALRSGGLESLFAEEAPKVEAVYLVTDTGLLVKDVLRQESSLNPDIFSGMLTTVGDFVKDSLSMFIGEEKEGGLNTLGYENYRIVIEGGKNTNLVVILTGKENEFLINDMREILVEVNKTYANVLKKWNGEYDELGGIEKLLEPLISSGKYDGIDYTKDNPIIKRNRLFENILLGITRHSKVNPSILCIEDLQWVDPSSLALLHYVAQNTRKCNLLIIGTYRPEDVSSVKEGEVHHLIDTMQLMSREDLYRQIELGRLEEEYIDEMLNSILGKTDFSDDFKRQLYSETEGNPFFIVSLIRMLIEENTIRKENDFWILTKDLKDTHIPSRVFDVIARRLYRVKEQESEILEYAAVIGEEFTTDILAQVTKLDRIKILKLLRILEQKHRLIRSIEPKYKFDHAKIKEALYSQIPIELRKEYHALIADAIEKLSMEDNEAVIGDLAFHYYNCKNENKALYYLEKAAEKAKKDYSNEEAIRFYKKALEFEENKQKRRDIFEVMGDIYRLIGDFKRSIDLYNNAIDLTEEKGEIAEIKGKIGLAYEKLGNFNETIRIGKEALNLVKGEKNKEEALALFNIGFASMRLGNYDMAFENYKKSLEIGQKIDNKFSIGKGFKGIAGLHEYKGEYDEAVEAYKKSLECWMELDDLRNIAIEELNIAFTLGRLGKYEKSLEFYEKSQKNAEKIGLKGIIASISWGLAEVYYGKGDLDNALYFTQKALKISKKVNNKEIIGEAYRLYGMIYGKQKKWEESIKNFEQSFKIFEDIGMKMELGENYYEFGLMWKAKGDIDKAKEHFQKSIDIFEELKIEKKMENVKTALESL